MSKEARKTERRKACKQIFTAVLIIALFAGIGTAWVATNAYAAELQYEINRLNQSIQAGERTNQNLEVRIKSASNITNIEQKAFELGMIYPSFDQIIYLSSDVQIQDFAVALKESVY